ncbi:gliding motility-associated C-terminal domain-containing protein [Marivirga sp. S37H4]|uniref:Gliding motility-associated C-terminal domain-containing protein n=1 Tax=Marivirga aurantiaca TaxID=2802615 RepID=A0A934X024_9BACT|nr:gliding motility-associated C-terminal domain-containing protein [Marivirga aurantiaca]MBK6266027.1 gliding motility-associated C-terminal domain-containing protein [Marivirga aurantiaca]
MKKFLLTFSILIFGLSPLHLWGQASAEGVKYRVVAVSHTGDRTVSVSNDVELFNSFSIEVPTAFTPNNDGLNDKFGAVAKGVKEYKLVIYNRYGEVVFNTNSLDHKWDGTYNGKQVSTGGYMYEVIAKSHEGEDLHKSGKVVVII